MMQNTVAQVLMCALALAALMIPVSALTLTPGSSPSDTTISNGDSVFINGIATGHPSQGLQVWILGPNYLKVSSVSVNDDNTYSFELMPADTMQLASGQYYVLVQHPMMNAQFDIVYDASTGRIINRQLRSVGSDEGTTIAQVAGAGSLQSPDSAYAIARAISSQNVDDTFAQTGFSVAPPNAPINPIGDHIVGDKFTISGNTNLAVGDDLSVTVTSSSFIPTSKTQSGEFSGASGVVKVVPGAGSLNQWSLDVDTSAWKPDEYIVTVEGITINVRESATFNLLSGPRVTTQVPTPTLTAIPVPTTLPPTTAVPTIPPTTKSPLTVVPVLGAFALVSIAILHTRKR